MGTIWVHAEANDGQVATITLELLAKARELGDAVAVYAGDADGIAAELGAHGATKVLATGDIGGGLVGPALASAMAGAIAGGDAPAAIMLGTTQDGRDVAGRLSVKLDAPVITNVVELADEGGLVGTEPVFGGTTNVKTKFTGGKAGIFLIRPKSFAAEASPAVAPLPSRPSPSAISARPAPRKVQSRFVEESPTVPSSTRQLSWSPVAAAWASPTSSRWSRISPRRSAAPLVRHAPSSTPAGCPTATRWARPARS